tara:strand:+ start:1144 stop:1263 length:120 start_codon:yes stop_codon:yes gene_type:complete
MRGGNFGGMPTWEIILGMCLVAVVLGIGFILNEAYQYVS